MTAIAIPVDLERRTVRDVIDPVIELVTDAALPPEYSLLQAPFAAGCREELRGEAVHIWFRILLEEFHTFREGLGLPCDETSTRALDSFAEFVSRPDSAQALVARWPHAVEVLSARGRMAVDNAARVARSWHDDRRAIVDAGLVSPGFEVDAISFGAGDSHYGGQTVAILSSLQGERLVFKPRSAEPDRLLGNLLALLSEASGVDLAPCAPRTVAGEACAWQEFVDSSQVQTPEEVSRYYQRFGLLAGLFAAIGAGDLHHENILGRGSFPCVVDSETLLQPGVVGVEGHLGDVLLHAGEHSPASTLMLPVRVRTGAFDVFVCALGVPWEQRSSKETFELAHDGTDAVQIRRSRLVITHEANVLRCLGAPIDPLDHVTELLEGYLLAHRALSEREADVAQLLTAASSTRFRVVLRPTEVYAKFVDARVHPSALVDASAGAAVPAILRDLEHNDQGRVTQREREDIYRLDVPAFHCGGTSRHIEWCELPVSDDFFPQSPVESAIYTLHRFCRQSAQYHRFALETSLSELSAGSGRPFPTPMLSEAVSAPPEHVTDVIVDLLDAVAHHGANDEGERAVGWLSHLGHDALETFELDRAMTFHDTAGLVAMLRSRRPSHQLTAPAGRGLGLRVEPDDAVRTMSVFAGPFSDLMSHGSYPGFAPDRAAGLGDGPMTAAEADVMGGLAGRLLVEARLDEADVDWLARAAHRLGSSGSDLVWERPWWDLAHGRMGVDWALFRAQLRLGADTAQVAQALRSGLHVASTAADCGPSWCAGAAGALVVAADLHQAGVVVPPDLIERLATKACALPDGVVDVSVCHGVSGSIQALLRAHETGALPEGRDRAADLWRRACDRMSVTGLQTGVPGRSTIIGYHLGWAGVADTLARLIEGPTCFDAVALLPFNAKEN